MANTRFKTENGLLVTGGNAQFDDVVRMNANLVVSADLLLVTGDLQVQGSQVFTGGQIYDSDIVATSDGLDIGNTSNRFDAYLKTVRVGEGLFPFGNATVIANTIPLGNSTNRWVIAANTLNTSGNANVGGDLGVTGTANIGGNLGVVGNANVGGVLRVTSHTEIGGTLAVTGISVFSSNVTVDSGTLFVDTLNNRVGINDAAPAVALAVTGNASVSGTLNTGGFSTGAGNVNFDSGVLFVDAVNNRIGINNTAPGVALRITGNADISSSANVQGNANVGGTLGVVGNLTVSGVSHTFAGNSNFESSTLFVQSTGGQTRVGIGTNTPDAKLQVIGAANVGGALRVGGVTTVDGGLTVTGITNTSSQFNVGGGVATTNGVSITNTSIAVGNSTSYTNIQPITTATFIPASSQEAQIKYANSTGTLWFYQAYSHLQDFWSLNRASGTSWLSTMLAAYRGNNSLLFNANAIAMVGNVNIDSGVLYVDALNNRVGINNTAPGVELRVTGAADISSSLNVGTYATGTVNGFSVTNNALSIGNTTANAVLTGSSLRINATSATLNVGTAFTVNSSLANVVALNVVNQTNTATLYVTTSANVGTAFAANTTELSHIGRITFSNTSPDAVVIGNPASRTKDSTSIDSHVTLGRTYTGAETSYGMWLQNEIANSTLTTNVFPVGSFVDVSNKSQNRNSLGQPVTTSLTGTYVRAINGPGNSAIWGSLVGVRGRVEQSANGSAANSTYAAYPGYFDYEVLGSGVTDFAFGVIGQVLAGNNSVTGNIGTAAAVHSTILSNTAMTIGTGYLFYGVHYGTKTTNKYGLYLLNEGNNYLSANLFVLGGSITVGNSSVTTTITGNTNARGTRTIRAYTGSASGGSSGDIIYEY